MNHKQTDHICFLYYSQDEKRIVPFADIKKLHQSIVKEAKELFTANQFRVAFVKFKRVSSVAYNHSMTKLFDVE